MLKRRIVLVGMACLLLLIGIACGTGGEQPSGSAPATETPGVQPQGTQTPTDVSVVSNTPIPTVTSVSEKVVFQNAEILETLQKILGNNETEFVPEELDAVYELKLVCDNATDLSELRYFKNLVYLEITGCSAEQLVVLKELPTLEYLYLDTVPVQKLSELFGSENITLLALNNTEVTSLEGLKQFTHLEELYITGSVIADAEQYRDEIERLSECEIEVPPQEETALYATFLDAVVEKEIRQSILNFTMDISMEELDSITLLMLLNPEVCALDDLVQCKNLKTLILMNTKVTNFFPILSMNQLEEIMIYTDLELDYTILLEKDTVKKLCVNGEWLKGSETE